MRLETFSLQGMLRFSDPVRVDLRDLPPGLVAIIGENGAGKTSLMEAPLAALYRTFPSRADREVVDYASRRDSHLEATFAVDGRGIYRARVNVDGVRRSAEAVLTHAQADGGETILNDGKVTTYDQVIRRTFPPAEVLLASAFSAQNRAGSFATLDRKGRKALFSQLLGLEHYETMAATARQAAQQIEAALSRVQVEREVLARGVSDDAADRLAVRLATIADDTAVQVSDRDRLAGEILQAAAQVATLTEQAAQHRAAVAESDAARVEVMRLERAIADAGVDAGVLETQARTDRQDAMRQHDQAAIAIAGKVANNRMALDQAATIWAAVAEAADLQTRLDALRATDAATTQEVARLRAALDAAVAHERELASASFEVIRLANQASTLTQVPCGGVGEYAPCPLIRLAQQAAQDLPAAQALVAQQPAAASASLAASLAHTQAEAGLAQTRARIAEAQARLRTLAPTVALEGPLQAAEARIAELEGQLADLLHARDARLVDIDARSGAAQTLIDERVAQARAALVVAQRASADAATRVAATRDAQRLAADAVAERDRLQRAHGSAMATLARLDAEHQALLQEAARVAEVRQRADALDAQIQTLTDELLDWRFLAKALGRDGLPVLEIDGAGPTVSSYANALLEACACSRFSVQLTTQEAKADGKGLKETFELKVFDAERGGAARDLADLSGGEQILVEEALKNALSIFANQRSETPIQTCWRDETTGALDGENASRYLAMLRKVREIGGFHHVLFVTHNRDAAQSADAQIVVADGGATIHLAPFDGVAA